MSALKWIGCILATLAVLSLALGFSFFVATVGAIVGAVLTAVGLVFTAAKLLQKVFEKRPE